MPARGSERFRDAANAASFSSAKGAGTAKLPLVGLIVAVCETPLTVTMTLPDGMSEPAAMEPVICMLAVPAITVGGVIRLKYGWALVTTCDSVLLLPREKPWPA
jgi:hypothetical protein